MHTITKSALTSIQCTLQGAASLSVCSRLETLHGTCQPEGCHITPCTYLQKAMFAKLKQAMMHAWKINAFTGERKAMQQVKGCKQ